MTEAIKKMAELLEVPVLTRGNWKGTEMLDMKQVASDTIKAMPYLKEAIDTGVYRGNNPEWSEEPVPAFININHDILQNEYHLKLLPETVKDWAMTAKMIPETRLINGEEWLVTNFENVDPELAKLLSSEFPFRSVEFLPNFKNPDTGEVYPVVVRAVSFLDRHTKPAVPQSAGFAVKLSADEMGVQTVYFDAPNINTDREGETPMQDDKKQGVVTLSADDHKSLIGRLDALEAQAQADGDEKEKLREIVRLQEEKIDRADRRAHEADAMSAIVKLTSDFGLTKAAEDLITPVFLSSGNVVKLSNGEEISNTAAFKRALEGIIKLAIEGNLTIPESPGVIQAGIQDTDPADSAESVLDAKIIKLMKEAAEIGKPIKRAQAHFMALSDREYSAQHGFFAKLERDTQGGN